MAISARIPRGEVFACARNTSYRPTIARSSFSLYELRAIREKRSAVLLSELGRAALHSAAAS